MLLLAALVYISNLSGRVWANSIGMKFVRVQPGEFRMGTTKEYVDNLARLDPFGGRDVVAEQPEHSVRITQTFSLRSYEVTQGQYLAVVGENPSNFKQSNNRPVEQVSWIDAVKFCNRLSERDGRKPYYRLDGDYVTIAGANGYRLPTEAEWEWACRAGSSTLFPFGRDDGALSEYAWNFVNSHATEPVGQRRPNAWGLYDMLGNVQEWCADWYDEKYYVLSPAGDPQGRTGGTERVARGGSYMSIRDHCRPAARGHFPPRFLDKSLGFRVAADQD